MKKLICLIMTIMMLFTFSSCFYVKQAKYEVGKFQGYISFRSNPLQVALRSNTDVFDIDNVSFDFYIGTYNITEAKKDKKSPGDFYHAYAYNSIIFLKMICVDYLSYQDSSEVIQPHTIIDNYKNEPYTITVEDFSSKALTTEYGYKKNMWVGGSKYNHNEKWEVPKECFINDTGVISLGIMILRKLTEGGFYVWDSPL